MPRLTAGLRLHGEYRGSGFTEPRYIARRGDGQVLQLSRLLYLVTRAIDGRRDLEGVSHRVSAEYGRELSTENIAYLIDRKLEPLGVTVPPGQENDQVDAPRSDLLLALRFHKVLFRESAVARIAGALSWLHRPLLVALVLLGMGGLDAWLFGSFGAITPVLHTLDQPVLLLAVFALTVASLVFHEFGHASACRYGGASPGCIGCGIFLVWPSLYTDVTDVYRIGRSGRLRTDLGGVYFNLVFMLGLAGLFFLTGQQFLLGAVYLGHFEVLEQLMPAVRLDGYYILGDLAGVPDLYGKIRPILLSALPGRPTHPEVAGLKRSARTVVTVWVLTMIPLLLGDLGYALWNLPRIVTTGVRSLTVQLVGTADAFGSGRIAEGLLGVVGSVMLICPLLGMGYLSVRLGGRLIRAAVAGTRGKPGLRLTLGGVALGGAAALSLAWAVGVTPRPLPEQPPIVPVLQPGVPTTAPSSSPTAVPTRPHTRRPHPSATAHAGPSSTPRPNPSATHTSKASGRATSAASGTASATPKPSGPAAQPASGPTPSASPTPMSSPTPSPPPPSVSASGTATALPTVKPTP
ncbi:hypothetical protein [Phaeacidiphilus oryzae]|uniref:hypothetical protein n=1 Tax=Phaeacidiphilus oryzae TaxID=348818 RepID=UPI000ADFE4F1|nr:hypothetical protein [Phaeacidiphilus oryzae]